MQYLDYSVIKPFSVLNSLFIVAQQGDVIGIIQAYTFSLVRSSKPPSNVPVKTFLRKIKTTLK